ncbi:transcriptional repressor AdcR for Zn(2+)-responsive expression [Streptococcus equinus]|nr:transcriptional repressor AdcR for Zn(2+)-responsive expression [Streptococcus equinus]
MLLSQERLTNSALAKRLNISQAAVTKAIKCLVKEDMLAPVKNRDDARVTYFELTELARPVADEHTHHHDATLSVYRKMVNEFSDKSKLLLENFWLLFQTS